MMRVKRYLMRYPKERRTTMVGPNCAGIISAGRAMLGIMPGHIYLRATSASSRARARSATRPRRR
jgi:malate-CoA ligase subunit alpha